MVAVTATIVSTGKPTNESSTAAGGVPNRAVDGNTDGNWWANSCTHTDIEAKPWWTVDLQETYAVEKVL
jgi:alpha-L-fucosidase